MMYKEIIREYLLGNGRGAYSKILEIYREQMAFLGTPARFRWWLARELDIPIEKINLNSLNSALKRQRKKKGPVKQAQPDHANDKIEAFNFSKPSSDDQRQSRIKEF